jgi:hypothetical protein
MLMWMVIVYTITIIVASALWYLSSRIGKFEWIRNRAQNDSKKIKIISWCLILALLVLITAVLNLANAAVCALYFADNNDRSGLLPLFALQNVKSGCIILI